MANIPKQEWLVDFHPEFEVWLNGLTDHSLIEEILKHAKALKYMGPSVGRPLVDTVKGSKYPNMKELRMQYAGDPWRFLFAFDPLRQAIVLVGGNKAGKPGWYDVSIPIADARYADHLRRQGTAPRKGGRK